MPGVEPQSHLSGEYIAAMLAATIGTLALGAVVVGSELDKSFEAGVFKLGGWIPHADRIGPYSGKETVMLVAWLGSWLLLHLGLRHREMDPRPWFAVALALL